MDSPGQRRQDAALAALAGALATGVGLGVGHVVGAVSGPASSPVIAVGGRAIDLSPAPLKEWAVATFGSADKAVLIGGVVVVTLLFGALVGLLARRSLARGLTAGTALAAVALAAAYDPGRPSAWFLPGAAALVAGAGSLVLLVRPEGTASGAAGGAAFDSPVGTPSGTPGGSASYTPAGSASGTPVGSASGTPAEAASANAGQGSRRNLFRMVAAGGVALLGWFVGERIRDVGARTPAGPQGTVVLPSPSGTPLPAGVEAQLPGVSPFVTPASEFYRVDTLLFPPVLDAATWRLSIDGLVERPYSLGFEELLAMDVIERPVTLACVSNPVGGEYVGSALWLGVRTSELLRRAGVRPGADQVLSTSIDGFTVSTPLQALLDDRDALVAFGMNGAPLPVEHGYPVRLLTPGLYGFVGATKWLVRMEVTTYAAADAYWTGQGWATDAPILPSARIEVPRRGSRVGAGVVKVGGTAWAHGVGVGGVQVRVDRGPWQDATLGPDAGVQYWRQWLWAWDAAPGTHELQVRVVDALGVPQSERPAAPFPKGASGLHTITVSVG